ncbi:outer membrane protein assembly factor BamB family protein [Thermogemmatispora onikobensis]|uniref:outer membrane protein assembly factor BamB family protein n=1 Tax=Thermogemmatispora onikobensis TaxID=732234 RepID=UPI000852CBAF|nr:PQQ-binding-like beta-propeller repeat protein [Thermogemmatispora onikobensis]
MRGKRQECKHALGKLLVCAILLVVSLLGCQQGMATVPLETAPCAAAQLQVHVTGLAGPLARSEVATLYVGGGTWLYALDAGSGFPRWCRVLQWRGPSQQNPLMGFGAIRHVGQELFAGIQYGYLLGLDAQNGAVRWGVEMEAGSEFWMEPAVDEGAGQVYGVGLSEVKALKLSDGQERWSYRLSQKRADRTTTLVHLAPVVGEKVVYVVGDDLGTVEGRASTVVALDVSTGKPRWTRSIPEGRAETYPLRVPQALLLGEGVLCLDVNDEIIGMRASDGRQLWQVNSSQWGDYQLIGVGQGRLYVAKEGKQEGKIQVSGLRLEDGQVSWSVELAGEFDRFAAPLQGLMEGQVLYLVDGQGGVEALDGQSGRVLWQRRVVEGSVGGLVPSRLVIGERDVYVMTMQRDEKDQFMLNVLDKYSGQAKWKVELPLPVVKGWILPVLAM